MKLLNFNKPMKPLIFFVLTAVGLADTRVEHFASPTGAGSHDGSSWANAWSDTEINLASSWGSGEAKISPGETLYLDQGDYPSTLTPTAGGSLAGGYIYIKPGAGHPTLSAGHDGVVTINGITTASLSYFDLDGTWSGFPPTYTAFDAQQRTLAHYKLVFTKPTGNGVHFKGSHLRYTCIASYGNGNDTDGHHGFYSNTNSGSEPTDVIISQCLIANSVGDGINYSRSNMSSVTNLIVELCHITGNWVDGMQRGGGMTVRYNYFDGSGVVAGTHGDAMQCNQGNMWVIGNVFRNWPQTLYFETILGNSPYDNIRVINNLLFYDGSYPYMKGVILENKAIGTSPSCDGLIIANNTFNNMLDRHVIDINPSRAPFTIRNSLIANNLIRNVPVNWMACTISNVDATTADYSFKNNTVEGAVQTTQFDGVTYSTIAGMFAALPSYTGNVAGEIGFVASSLGDFTLSAGSSAIGTALDLSAYFDEDILRQARPAGDWSRGAFNPDSTVPTPPSATSTSVDGDFLVLNFSEQITYGSGGNSGFTLSMSGGAVSLTYYAGAGSASVTFSTNRTIAPGETGTLAYAGTGWTDLAGNLLASFSGLSVTNNTGSPSDTTPPMPDPLSILTVTNITSTSMTVNSAIATDAESPPVTYDLSVDDVWQTLWQTSTAFNRSGLTPGQSYRYRVRAKDAAGNIGTASAELTRATLAATSTSLPSRRVWRLGR